MINRLAFIAAAVLWGLLFFWIGFRVTFPSDAAVERLQWEVARATGDNLILSADEAGPWRLSGLWLEGVRLFKQPTDLRRRVDEDEEGPAPVQLLNANAVWARLALLPLLTGTIAPRVQAELYGGELAAEMAWSTDEAALGMVLENIDLNLIPIAGESFTLDLGGLLGCEMDLVINREDVAKSTGKGQVEIKDLVLLSGQLFGFDTPENQRFTEARLAFLVEDGRARITEGRLVGDMLDGTFGGEITLNKKLARSRLRIEMSFTLASDLDNLVKLVPDARDARDEQGVYHFVVTGTLEHPRMRPDRARTTSRRTRPERSNSLDSPEDMARPMDDEMDDLDDEERQKLRDERIQERRDRLKERREKLKQDRDVEEVPAPERLSAKDPDAFDEEDDQRDDEQPFDDRFEDDLPVDHGYEDVDLRPIPEDDEGYDYPD